MQVIAAERVNHATSYPYRQPRDVLCDTGSEKPVLWLCLTTTRRNIPLIPMLDDYKSLSIPKMGCLTATSRRVSWKPELGGRQPSSIFRGDARRLYGIKLPMERVFDGIWRAGCPCHGSVACHRAHYSMVLDGAVPSSTAPESTLYSRTRRLRAVKYASTVARQQGAVEYKVRRHRKL